MLKKEITKRSPNFTNTEIDFLLCQLETYKTIIECKKTDRTRAEEKIEAWKQIESAFNSKFGQVFRSYTVLKTKYENIKKGAKSRFAADRQQLYKTGGGVLPKSSATAIDDKISLICQPEQMLGNKAIYDDDIIQIGVYDERLDENENAMPDIDENTSWTKYTPKSLKASVHSALKSKKEKTKDVWAKVAEAKLLKIDLQMEGLRKQNELTETKLNLEIEKLKIEIQIMQKRLENL